MNHRFAAVATLSVLALGAVGCSQEDTPAAPPPAPPPATQTTENGATTATEPTASATAYATNPQERNDAALRAIATAAGAANGTAYGIDDEDDDNSWEVDVMAGDRSIEVKVSGDGNTVISQEDEVDLNLIEDDRARLDRATVTLEQAIETGLQEVPGALDEVELDDEDNQDVWKVQIDTPENDDIEVYVSTTAGNVLKVER